MLPGEALIISANPGDQQQENHQKWGVCVSHEWELIRDVVERNKNTRGAAETKACSSIQMDYSK